MNATRHIKILSWNVRGLNDRAKRVLVRHEVQKHSPHVLCIQETKWDMENAQYIRETIGSRIDNFGLIKANGTAGGVLLAWDHRMFTKIEIQYTAHTVSADLVVNLDNSVIRVTGVYGPATYRGKKAFFREIKQAKPSMPMPWLIMGDFNVTLNIQDRSNDGYPL